MEQRKATGPDAAAKHSQTARFPASPRVAVALGTFDLFCFVGSALGKLSRVIRKSLRSNQSAERVARRAGVALATIGLGGLGGLATGTSQAAEKPQQIPFRLVHGYVVLVQGRIGALDGLNLVFDTGASPSAVNERIANRLGLAGRVERLPLLQGETLAKRTTLPAIQIGSLEAVNVSGLVENLSAVERQLQLRVDAIIGLDVIGNRSFTIDYAARTITVGRAVNSAEWIASGGEANAITVEAKAGDRTARLLLDTGARELILFRCGSTAGRRNRDKKEQTISPVRVGTQDLGRQRIRMAEGEQLCGLAFDGVISPAGLQWKQVSFDHERRMIAWKK